MLDLNELPDGQRLNWEQCCTLLGCGKTHFYNLVNTGELPAIRTGKRKGISVSVKDMRIYMKAVGVSCWDAQQ